MPSSNTREEPCFQGIAIKKASSHRQHARSPANQIESENGGVSLSQLNSILNRLQIPRDVNEPILESILERLERSGDDSLPQYQLLTARLLEAALVCAGHYVDNCEFSAAGDLLVNPRQILVHRNGHLQPEIKMRHTKLSEQLDPHCERCLPFPIWFKHNAIVQISKPALIPDLLNRLELFKSFQYTYLESIRERMNKAADTIGFLSAWHLSGWEDLYRRMQSAAPQQRSFISESLCRFEARDFHCLGLEISQISCHADCRSNYLTA